VNINVTNTTAQPTTGYTLTLNTGASTINSQRWNGTFSGSTGNVTVTPAAFHAVIAPARPTRRWASAPTARRAAVRCPRS
jgi:hypothetical protein